MADHSRRAIPTGVAYALAVVLAAGVGALMTLWLGPRFHGEGTSSKGGTLAKVQETGVIRAGYIVWPPGVIKDPNTGKLSGHEVDTMEYIAKEMHATVEWEESNWDTFSAGLQSRFDVCVAGTYVTIPRAKAVAFTRPLFLLGTGALVKKGDTRFKSASDLNREGIVIACTQGTGEESWAKEHLPKATVKSLPGPNLDIALLEVVNGKADVALQDTYTVRQFAEKQQGVEALFVDRPLNLTAVAWSMRPDDLEWKNFLDSALLYLEFSGRLKEFEKRYDARWLHHPTDNE